MADKSPKKTSQKKTATMTLKEKRAAKKATRSPGLPASPIETARKARSH